MKHLKSVARRKRRGGMMFRRSFANYFRKKFCQKYHLRFIQGIEYKRIDHPLYKYEMIIEREVQTSWLGSNIKTEFFELNELGVLKMKAGYRWDGPSGPTIDTPSFMRSSATHDCFFQMLRMGLVCDSQRERFFKTANKDLKLISIEDGMLVTRASIVKFGVRTFGKKHTIKEAA